MKTKPKRAFARLGRGTQNLLASTFACVVAASIDSALALDIDATGNTIDDPALVSPKSQVVLHPAQVKTTDNLNFGAVSNTTAPAPGGGDDAAELAKKLQNPIASLISVPLQNNFDFGAGPNGDGFQYKVNIQPVIPISLNKDWNVISRTILPVVYQEKIIPEVHNGKVDFNASQSGLSDTTQSLFFSPKEPTSSGWIWGAGPVFLFPTATDDLIGSEKWGAGPTAVVLKQQHGWTYGILANQIWSFAGENGRENVNATFLQPFLSYTTKKQTSFTLNTESTYDWVGEQWTVPLNLSVAQLVKIGGAPLQFQVGGRYYAEKPETGPDWGLRFTVTFLFPK